MLGTKTFQGEVSNKGIYLSTLEMTGPEQMAIDEMLLEKAITNLEFSLTLRFYYWESPWLSIGKNQKLIPKRWLDLISEKKLRIVKRPSGGNAVLHAGGLTYALIWSFPPRKKHEAYFLASQWLIKGFYQLGLPLKFGRQAPSSFEKNCFATSTAADLIDPSGQKRVGSAQLWRKGHLLQHGEILLDPPPQLWKEVFEKEAPKPAPSYIPRKGLDTALKQACKDYWSEINWQHQAITQEELSQIMFRSNKFCLSSG